MSFLVSKNQPALSKAENNTNNNSKDEDQEDPEILTSAVVTTHAHLKPAHSTEALDKEVVLRRIRQRKRYNKVRAGLQRFFGLPVSSKTEKKVSVRWVDDAFAAPRRASGAQI